MSLRTLRDNPLTYWALVFAYALGIFILSSNPKPPEPRVLLGIYIPYMDKIEHFFLYGLFGILVYVAFIRTERFNENELFSFIFGVLYAFTDEIHQYFVPGRACDPWDLITDAIGIVAGMAFYIWKWRKL